MRNYQNRTRWCATLLCGCLAIGVTVGAAPSPKQDNDDEAKQTAFAKEFWEYLQKVDYQEEWSRWPGQDQEFTEGTSPHGAFLKVYVNATVAGNLEDPPVKSIIIKENYDEDKELVAITPMYKVSEDYDPENDNWYWAKYKPDGTLFEKDGIKISGKVKGCIECHSSAEGGDYIFTNDD